MTQNAQTFRVFISSTFSDLKAERNALQTYVFPRLRELCDQHGARFQPIDLRWGVSDEASLDQQAMNICLGEVDRCQKVSPRPNFIVLLGNRYGWMPPPAQIPESEYLAILTHVSKQDQEFLDDWYKLDTNAVPPERCLKPRIKGGKYERYADWQPVESKLQGILSSAVEKLSFDLQRKLVFQASATHQEIVAGAQEQEHASEHVFCFFRDIPELPNTFSKAKYVEMLNARLMLEHPKGLGSKSMDLVSEIRNKDDGTTPKEIHEFLKAKQAHLPKRSTEEGLLQLMEQVLIDITARDFINLHEETWHVDVQAKRDLSSLKEELRAKFRANLYEAKAVEWRGGLIPSEEQPYQLVDESHIGRLPESLEDCMLLLEEDHPPKNLCEAVFRSLGRVIQDEIKNPHTTYQEENKIAHIEPSMVLDVEGLTHYDFAESRLKYFVGREEILREISDYLGSSKAKVLAIVGKGGTGKSALMAKVAERVQKAHSNAHLVYRFIGASAGSSDGRSLLESLCKEISRCYDADESDIPQDFRELISELAKRMSLASDEKPLILLIDSLDQLSKSHDARRLSWLPEELPKHVSLIVSTRPKEEDITANLKQKRVVEKPLGGLNESDGSDLLNQLLADVNRVLTKKQENEVISKFIASQGNPLYLKLAFEEARLWTSFQEKQEELAVDVTGIIKENMINRLKDESNHGNSLVSYSLGYIAASRYGLAEDELVDLLSRDLDVYEWFFRQTYHLPSDLVRMAMDYLREHPELAENMHPESYHDQERLAIDWLKQDRNPPEPVKKFLREVLNQAEGPRLPIVLWSRLSFDLAPYLSERTFDGSTLLNFYHRELEDISREAFLDEKEASHFHAKLASYFRSKADPNDNQSWIGGHKHGLSELPYHLTLAGERDKVFNLLTDFKFLEHKAEEVGITRKTDEFGRDMVTSEGVLDLQKDYDFALETFYHGSGSSSRSRDGTGPLIRTVEKMSDKLLLHCPVCNKKSEVIEKMLGEEITCPQKDCKTKLKLNTFTIKMD